MKGIDQLRKDLAERLSDSPVAPLCLSLLDFAGEQRDENLRFLTYTALAKAAGSTVEDPLLIAAIHTLEGGAENGLLEKHYLFADGSGYVDPIDDDVARDALVAGEIVLRDGTLVGEPEKYLVPYFSASKCLLAAKKV